VPWKVAQKRLSRDAINRVSTEAFYVSTSAQ